MLSYLSSYSWRFNNKDISSSCSDPIINQDVIVTPQREGTRSRPQSQTRIPIFQVYPLGLYRIQVEWSMPVRPRYTRICPNIQPILSFYIAVGLALTQPNTILYN